MHTQYTHNMQTLYIYIVHVHTHLPVQTHWSGGANKFLALEHFYRDPDILSSVDPGVSLGPLRVLKPLRQENPRHRPMAVRWEVL